MSDAEESFALVAPPGFYREERFHGKRRWRFDFLWPAAMLAVEIEGRGRHQTVVGYRLDCEKYNAAAEMGYSIFRFPATDYKPSRTRKQWPGGAADWAEFIKQVLETRL